MGRTLPATDLRFVGPQPASLDLRFGSVTGGADVYIDLTLTATLVSSPLVASLSLGQDNAVNRSPKLWQAASWQEAGDLSTTTAAPHRQALKTSPAVTVPLPAGLALPVNRAAAWDKLTRQAPGTAAGWGEAAPIAAVDGVLWANLETRLRPGLRAIFADATALGTASASPWKTLARHRRPAPVLPWGEGRPLGLRPVLPHNRGRRLGRSPVLPWGEGRLPGPGISPRPGLVVPTTPPCYQPLPGAIHLRFVGLQPASLDLRFACPNAGGQPALIVVPVQRVYMQTNTVTLVLADTGQPIPARNLRLSIDADSWCWGWSASVPATYLTTLQAAIGDLVELIATVNGTPFRLAVERLQRDRRFGDASLSISGRGRAAFLADPYADTVSRYNTGAMTAQQLMAAALTVNGVSYGWSLDWRITDWLVPAGVWSHTGSAMEACLTIADAAGAYIQAHRTDQTLIILPRYPVAPWNWPGLTPDIDLPEDVCTTEGVEWLDKPQYNTVFVSGQQGGILAHVTRGGTAGDKAAPMVTDPLITHSDAGLQRGTRILSDAGRQKLITLNLPVLNATGVIEPGKLVRYTENGTQHLGLTRSVDVNFDFPAVHQTIQVETHVL